MIPQPTRTPLVFFSLRLADPAWRHLTDHALALRGALRTARRARPFEVDSIVVLPSALHTIWALPAGDDALLPRVSLLRSLFAQAVEAQTGLAEEELWQDHLVPHRIDQASDVAAWREMIHSAPVTTGLSAAPEAWQYSSIHRARDAARAM
ncbi:MAG: transposase [Pseudomonadota bacterium]